MEGSIAWVLMYIAWWPTSGLICSLFILGITCVLNYSNRRKCAIHIGHISILISSYLATTLLFLFFYFGFQFYPNLKDLLKFSESVERFNFASIIFHLWLILFSFSFVYLYSKKSYSFLGWIKYHIHPNKKDLYFIGVSILILGVSLPLFFSGSGWTTPGKTFQQDTTTIHLDGIYGFYYYLTLIWFILFVPFIEEMFFRGVLFDMFEEYYPSVGSLLATTLIFSLTHGGSYIIFAFSIGLLFGALRMYSNKILPGFISHVILNATPL